MVNDEKWVERTVNETVFLRVLGDHGEKYIHKHRNFFVNLQRSSPDLENAVLKVAMCRGSDRKFSSLLTSFNYISMQLMALPKQSWSEAIRFLTMLYFLVKNNTRFTYSD